MFIAGLAGTKASAIRTPEITRAEAAASSLSPAWRGKSKGIGIEVGFLEFEKLGELRSGGDDRKSKRANCEGHSKSGSDKTVMNVIVKHGEILMREGSERTDGQF